MGVKGVANSPIHTKEPRSLHLVSKEGLVTRPGGMPGPTAPPWRTNKENEDKNKTNEIMWRIYSGNIVTLGDGVCLLVCVWEETVCSSP